MHSSLQWNLPIAQSHDRLNGRIRLRFQCMTSVIFSSLKLVAHLRLYTRHYACSGWSVHKRNVYVTIKRPYVTIYKLYISIAPESGAKEIFDIWPQNNYVTSPTSPFDSITKRNNETTWLSDNFRWFFRLCNKTKKC